MLGIKDFPITITNGLVGSRAFQTAEFNLFTFRKNVKIRSVYGIKEQSNTALHECRLMFSRRGGASSSYLDVISGVYSGDGRWQDSSNAFGLYKPSDKYYIQANSDDRLICSALYNFQGLAGITQDFRVVVLYEYY